LVYSDLWIGLGCAMQVAFTYLLLDSPPDIPLMILAGTGTVAVYNWQRLVRVGGRIPEIHTERHRWIERHRTPLWMLTIVSSVIACYYLLQFDTIFISITLGLGLIAFFYTLPWITGLQRKGLRDLPYLKLVLIAICWAGISAALPIYLMGDGTLCFVIIMERFLFILAITIPFDIRDLDYDDTGKRTVPQVFGENKAKAISLVIWLAATCAMVSILALGGSSILSHVLVLGGYMVTGLLLSGVDKEKEELYFTGAIDGMLVFIPLLLWSAWSS